MRGLKKVDTKRGQIYRQIYKLTSHLHERIGLRADSLKIGKSGGGSRWMICYQQGLPRLVLVLSLRPTGILLKIFRSINVNVDAQFTHVSIHPGSLGPIGVLCGQYQSHFNWQFSPGFHFVLVTNLPVSINICKLFINILYAFCTKKPP